MTTHHARGDARSSASSRATPSARRTSSRSASSRWMYTRPIDAARSSGSRSASATGPRCSTRTSPRSRPGCTSARPPSCSTTPTRSSPRSSSRARYRNITGNLALVVRPHRRGAAGEAADPLRVVPDHAGVRHPARAVEAQELRRAARCRPKTRSPPRGAAVGAAFAGQLGVTATSGPGVDLKSEALGLAISLELPLVLVDVQRGGPSTGLPTKTEQADLLLAMYGRHGESPLPIVAAQSPRHCFDAAFEACASR